MNKYQEALDRLCENNYFDEKGNCNCDLIVMDRILMQELVDKAKELSDSNNELERTIHSLDCELSDVYNPKPYKFEDLKVGMWVLDRKPEYEEFTFIKITRILSESDCEYLYHDKDKKVFFDNMECHAREFEENRFFPVQMANLRR
ncbi:hypothetical protein [Thomasclavelia cocleata]|uniref:hypothetical protein n=1 Tax=Thomasclavelia cocleata TaxID=69824 RepID=UPI0025580C0E|nr:hypothetical protein [Thomasclavelia cocleata]